MKKKTYDVGYCKPPKRTQFKPGQSGNIKGRPKRSRDVSAMLDRILQEKVDVIENDRKSKIPGIEAILKRLVNRALKGDAQAIKQVLAMLPEDGKQAITVILDRADSMA